MRAVGFRSNGKMYFPSNSNFESRMSRGGDMLPFLELGPHYKALQGLAETVRVRVPMADSAAGWSSLPRSDFSVSG